MQPSPVAGQVKRPLFPIHLNKLLKCMPPLHLASITPSSLAPSRTPPIQHLNHPPTHARMAVHLVSCALYRKRTACVLPAGVRLYIVSLASKQDLLLLATPHLFCCSTHANKFYFSRPHNGLVSNRLSAPANRQPSLLYPWVDPCTRLPACSHTPHRAGIRLTSVLTTFSVPTGDRKSVV